MAGLVLALAGAGATAQTYGLGSPAAEDLLRAWDIDVRPNGAGLPPGEGSASQGALVYARRCAVCHGARGEGGPQDRLAGGHGTLAGPTPVKTVGSFWPYATTLFDYVRRAMPFDAPQSLSADEVYALTAYLLHLNGILPADAGLDRVTLPQVLMPNRAGFLP